MTQTSSNCDLQPHAVGTVFLIGAGPGDPGLITVRGLEKIRAADVVIYDYLADEALVREAKPTAELIYVGKKGGSHTLEQEDINALLIRKAKEGKSVARLKGGDPYVFGRGGEEAQELVAAGIPFEVVPGVSSAVAAPAYAGIPVTHRDHASMVTFVTGHEDPSKQESAIDWDLLARNPGTLVFLMGVKNLGNISSHLINHGKSPSTPAALIQWGTTARQVSVFSTLERISGEAEKKGIKPPAVLVVGSAASLHDELAWFEKKPLFGKRILVTRTREQSARMAQQIVELGGEPILFPTIKIFPPEDFGPLDQAIEKIETFDWLIFTSVNGVEAFFRRFFQLDSDVRELAGPRIGAIGPVTAQAIRDRGIRVELLAKEFTAEGILELFTEEQVRGKRFLVPRAEKARDVLPQGIAARGGEVEVVPVYRTGIPEDADMEAIRSLLEKKRVDAATFTSSSTVTHFIDMLRESDPSSLLRDVVVASIGPITSRTIRANGLRVDVQAREYTVDGLLKALSEYFVSQ